MVMSLVDTPIFPAGNWSPDYYAGYETGKRDQYDADLLVLKEWKQIEADWLEEQGKMICNGCDCVKCMATCRIIKSWQAHIAKLREGK